MNLLTDHQIRERLSRGGLVEGGLADDAVGCSYKFKSGKIFPAGRQEPPLDWDSESVGCDEFTAEPGTIFWIRTNHKVHLPDDICAFWWQTNELSKKGIMLVNMSMVDPGYRGYLACLFVNFGNQRVLIHRDTTVARLVFVQLGTAVESPFRGSIAPKKYDGQLREISINAASSFLQVNEQAARVSEELKAFERNATENRQRLEDETERLKKSLDSELKKVVAENAEEIKKAPIDALKKSFGWYLALVTLGVVVWNVFNWFIDRTRPYRDEQIRKEVEEQFIKVANPAIQQIVDDALRRRLTMTGTVTNVPTGQPKSP